MDSMMGMMDMNQYYGPPDYNSVVGIFGFPEAGPWRVWIYMKMELPNGEHRLIVPEFNIFAPIGGGNVATSTSASTSTATSATTSSQASSSQVKEDSAASERGVSGMWAMSLLLCILLVQ